MVHPFKIYKDQTPIEKMDQITVTLQIFNLFRGFPHGIALIAYKDPQSKRDSFRGIGVFNNKQLHNGPFTCVNDDGWGLSFSRMQYGRPANGSYFSQFYP